MTWLSDACPRIVHFDEDDEEAERQAVQAELKRRMDHAAKLAAHPCPNDPQHPGEFKGEA